MCVFYIYILCKRYYITLDICIKILYRNYKIYYIEIKSLNHKH